jgi:hypothetical protein
MPAPLAALGQGDRGADVGGHDDPQGRPVAVRRAVGRGRDTDPAAEEHGKVTRGLKTDAGCDIGNGQGGLFQQCLRARYPACQEVLVGSDPGSLPKGPQKVILVHLRDRGEVPQGNRLSQMLGDVGEDAAQGLGR